MEPDEVKKLLDNRGFLGLSILTAKDALSVYLHPDNPVRDLTEEQLKGILTGAILALARALGETAPLVVVGASTAITFDPDGPFSKFTVLPIQIYQWTARPQDEFRNIAAAAIIVLLVLLFTLNATAILLRNRYSRKAQQ